jgi:hypothetical protein
VVCKFQWRVSPMYLNQFAVEWHGSLNSMTIPSFSLSFPRLGAWPTGRHVWLIGESLWQRDESWRRKRGVSTGRDMSRLVQNVGNQRKSLKDLGYGMILEILHLYLYLGNAWLAGATSWSRELRALLDNVFFENLREANWPSYTCNLSVNPVE